MSQMFAFAVEINDLTASVVWANVPDANITESSVTQHEAAIDHDLLLNYAAAEHFLESAISIPLTQGANDVTALAAELNLLDLAGRTAGDILSADTASTASWKAPPAETNDLSAAVTWANVPDANITEGSVTQHEAALTITQAQGITVSETSTNLLDITHAINTGALKVASYQVWDSTNLQPVWAAGDTDGAVWVDGAGTTVHTPV